MASPTAAVRSAEPDGSPALSELGADARGKPLYPLRGPLSTSGIETLRDTNFRKEWAAFRIEIGNEGWNFPIGDPDQTAQDFIDGTNVSQLNPKRLKLQGTALISTAERAADPPVPNGQPGGTGSQPAKPGFSVEDLYGPPRPAPAAYRLPAQRYTRQGFKKAREVNWAIYKALGATEYSQTDKSRADRLRSGWRSFNYYGAGHIMGTTLMGSSRANSVLDDTSQELGSR